MEMCQAVWEATMVRRTARESALKALFQMDIGGGELSDAISFVRDESQGMEDDAVSYFEELSKGVHGQLSQIDSILGQFAIGWHVERMGAVDRNILRLAVYEFALAEPKMPIGVALNEAVELAKVYGDDESPRFINGVLANVVKGLQLLGRL